MKRQELRQKTKKHGELAGGFAKQYLKESIQRDDEVQKLDFFLELAVENIVKETTETLCGDKHLETALKKSVAPNSMH